MFNSAAVTRPTTWAVALATGAPTSVAASEIATGVGLNRVGTNSLFPTAVASSGSVSNSATVSFGTATGAVTISGVTIWDTSGATAGSMIAYGTLAGARALSSGDSLYFAPGNLTITLG